MCVCVCAYNENFLSIILGYLARVSGTEIVTATAHPCLLYLFILKKGELAKVERQEQFIHSAIPGLIAC